MPPKPAPRPKAPVLPNCPECGTVAAEPRLRYCENCGAKMPEYRAPTMMELEAAVEQERELAAPKKPPYTGPKWLEHVPGHSPTVLGVALHWVALGLSIIPGLASVGPFWSFVMLLGSFLVVSRELRAAGERGPLVDWVPEMAQKPVVTAVYTALAVGLSLPMLQFISTQPFLWLGGTALLVRDQWPKVFAEPNGYLRLFDPRSLVRGHRIMALVGVSLCVLALLLPWIEIKISGGNGAVSSVAGAASSEGVPRMFDSAYNGMEDIPTAGIDRPVAPTVLLALLTLLVLTMLRPEVDRPEWLRFVPAGLTVICVAWVLMNMKFKLGPILFLAGLVPVGLVAFMTAMGRDDLTPAYADEPAPEDDYTDDGAPYEDDMPPPSNDDEGRG